MSLELSATGFVAGQKVDVIVNVNNNCDVVVDEIKVSLKKCMSYNSTTPRKFTMEDFKPLEIKRLPGIEKRERKTLNLSFDIPAIPPTNQGFSSVISLCYQIEVKAKVANIIHKSATVNIPILIGTIPIYQHPGNNLAKTTGNFASTSGFNRQDKDLRKLLHIK